MLYILYSKINENLSLKKIDVLLKEIFEIHKKKYRKYKFWQDKQRFLVGRILLLKGLDLFGLPERKLNDIKYNEYGRPYFDSEIDFNISHSGEYVILAIASKTSLGIDIEKIVDVEFSDFIDTMNDKEWELIKGSKDSLRTFFWYWTLKESIIKADSKGLSVPLKNIQIFANNAICNSKLWYIREIKINRNYLAHLSTDKEIDKIILKYIEFN